MVAACLKWFPRTIPALAGIVLVTLTTMARADPPEKVLFDVEDAEEVRAWSNLELTGPGKKEPAVRIKQSTRNATSGKHSLELTFAGGNWPTITTTSVPGDWMPFWTF